MKKITLFVTMFIVLIFGVFITPIVRAEVSTTATSVANSVVSNTPITPPITGGCMTVSAENRLTCINNSLVELSARVLKLEGKTTINTDKTTSTIAIPPITTGGCMTVSTENRLTCINNSLVELSARVLKLEGKTTINTTDRNTQSISTPTTATNTTLIGSVSSSAVIKAVQSFLKTEGSFTYPTATGYYGDITIEAVKKYQEKNGLPITGKIDSATLTKIQADVTQIAPALNAEISGIKKY